MPPVPAPVTPVAPVTLVPVTPVAPVTLVPEPVNPVPEFIALTITSGLTPTAFETLYTVFAALAPLLINEEVIDIAKLTASLSLFAEPGAFGSLSAIAFKYASATAWEIFPVPNFSFMSLADGSSPAVAASFNSCAVGIVDIIEVVPTDSTTPAPPPPVSETLTGSHC